MAAAFQKFLAPGLVAVAVLLVTCDAPAPPGAVPAGYAVAPETVRERLQGTWLRDYEVRGGNAALNGQPPLNLCPRLG